MNTLPRHSNTWYGSVLVQGPAEKPDDFKVKIKWKAYYLFTRIYY